MTCSSPGWLCRLGLLLFALIALLDAGDVSAQQVQMFTGRPLVDSFPIVRIRVSVTDSGRPPQSITSANFSLAEDGNPVAPLDLVNCIGSPLAAIAVLADASSSVFASAGNGNYDRYYDAYSHFLSEIPAPSELALIPFTDTIAGCYPGLNRPSGFYQAAVNPDTTEFMDSIKALQFIGNTYIDLAIDSAVSVLKKSLIQRKVIVLVTDDGIVDEKRIYALLAANNISLFIMEMDPDTLYGNLDMATSLGGKYYAAKDTNDFVPIMSEIGRDLFGESCELRYTSKLKCPWLAAHAINLHLAYKTANIFSLLSYSLGKNTHDSSPPMLLIDSSVFTARTVRALELYPCGSGIKTFTDSALVNFAKLRQRRTMPDSTFDSLVVLDTMQSARGYYIVRDSAGNTARILFTYQPKPDTNPPQLPLPTLISGAYTQNITETRPWDRGIKSVQLAAGAKNLVLDNVTFFSETTAQAYLHIVLRKDSASGCIVATDSVGNQNTFCYQWNGEGGDTLAPQFQQDPLAEPRIALSGIVTEARPGDVGIMTITLAPIANVKNPNVSFVSKAQANVSVTLGDSLYPATCAVEATDSAGNIMRDTLRYQPIADLQSPVLTLSSPTGTTRLLSATEIAPWDRGIQSMVVTGTLVNLSATAASFLDSRHASILFTILDPTIAASASALAIDSAGKRSTIDFVIPPTVGPGLKPLQIATPLDFGTIPAQTSLAKPISVTNPNAVDVTITKSSATGDDSVFSWQESTPITIAAGASQTLHATFAPQLIGAWNARYSFANDTMELASITLLGRSTGMIHFSLDTLNLTKGGDQGALRLRMDATPKPINVDTISFTMTYDPDVATLGTLVQPCSGGPDTGICNYTFTTTASAPGTESVQLVRNTKATSPTIEWSQDVFTIPVSTFVAKNAATSIAFSQAYAGANTQAITNDGLVSLGSICEDSMLRAKLGDKLSILLDGISPNPAGSELRLTLSSAGENQPVTIELIDAVGVVRQRRECVLPLGRSTLSLDLSAINSGNFFLRIVSGGRTSGLSNVQIVR